MTEPSHQLPAPGKGDIAPGTSTDPTVKSESKSKTTRPSPISSHQKPILDTASISLSKVDVTISRLDTLLSTLSGLETALSTIEYSSHALHHFLASSPSTALRNRLRLLLLRRSREQKSTAKSSKSPSLPSPSSPSSSSKPSLLALSSLVSETRYTLRLLALVSIWTWGSATAKSPPRDRILRIVAYLEVLSIFIYQALENVAYLASKGIFGNRIIKRWGGIDAWYLWSTRAWFAYVLLQFVRLGRETILFRQKEEDQKKIRAEEVQASTESLSETVKEEQEARRQEIRKWRQSLVNNLAWAPLCMHWSLEKGIGVPESLTGVISLLAGLWGAHDAWKATAATTAT